MTIHALTGKVVRVPKTPFCSMNFFRSQYWFLWIFWIWLPAAIELHGQNSEPLPTDSKITVRTLSNGLRYYIRENHEPENRAVFRLVVNAGSVLESEAHRGLAHFLEHMAFNGTRHFEKQELVNFLESIGMRFGADLNAYTSFDETVYMLEVPMDDAAILNRAFQILEDWAHEISFEPEEIEKERGVVIEEWRLGRGAQGRLRDQQIPVLLHASRYAERLPIGQVADIQRMDRDAFLQFYRDYYRPNLMAFIAVGDFETDDIEGLVQEHFGSLENPEGAPPRRYFPVPDHERTLYSIATDPELRNTMVQICYLRDPELEETVADYRRSVTEILYTQMLNQRLQERLQDPDPPYLYAGMGKSQPVRTKAMVVQSAVVKEGQYAEGIHALLVEARRCKQDGFTSAELERAKADHLRFLEMAYEEREHTESTTYAEEYTRNFLYQEPIPGIAYELEITRQLLPDIILEDVNRAADDWITRENRVVLYSAPEKPDLAVPTESEILAVIESAEAAKTEAYEEENLDAPLVSEMPQPGTIAEEHEYPEVDVVEWVLSNGMRVLLKSTDFKRDEVLMTAFSPGGNSLVPTDEFVPALQADTLVQMSGAGDFDLFQLRKKLAGKIARVGVRIDELFEGMQGSASPRDLETFFQLVYLRFMAPRLDPDMVESFRVRLKNQIENRRNDPEAVFSDAIEKTLYQDHPRHQPLSEAFLQAMDPPKSLQIYRDRFADAGDFTFLFVGAFDQESIRPLVERYLASLPGLDRKESWRDVGDDMAPGQQTVRVNQGLEPKSQVVLVYHREAKWSNENRYYLYALTDILRIRLREELREDQGGVYGVGVSGNLERWPESRSTIRISFGCKPENVSELIHTAEQVVHELQTDGPRESDVGKVREMHLRQYEVNLRENPYWLGALALYARNDLPFEKILEFPEKPNSLSQDRIRQAAQLYLDPANRLTAELFPESDASRSDALHRDPENPRYFADADGHTVYLTGSHTWNNLVDMGPTDPPPAFDFDAYIDWLRGYPHNFFRLWTWELVSWDTRANNESEPLTLYVAPLPYARTGPGNALDGKPKFDLEKYAPEYFQRLRDRVAAADQTGLYVAVMLFEGWGLQHIENAWEHHPFHPDNNSNGIDGDANGDGKGLEIHELVNPEVLAVQEAYVHHVLETLNEFPNVLYEISNENHPESTDWQYHMIHFIREQERAMPHQHPVGMTFQYRGGSNQTLFDSPADWVSPNPEGGYRDQPPATDGRKVVVNDTDHLWGIGGNPQWVWKSFLAGMNTLFMDPYQGRVLEGNISDANSEAIRQAMGQTLRIARETDLAAMHPEPDSASSGYALVRSPIPDEWFIFIPANESVQINLSHVTGDFHAEWLHPESGEWLPGEPVLAGKPHQAASPFSDFSILHLSQ